MSYSFRNVIWILILEALIRFKNAKYEYELKLLIIILYFVFYLLLDLVSTVWRPNLVTWYRLIKRKLEVQFNEKMWFLVRDGKPIIFKIAVALADYELDTLYLLLVAPKYLAFLDHSNLLLITFNLFKSVNIVDLQLCVNKIASVFCELILICDLFVKSGSVSVCQTLNV